jgi:hypothetical protein
VKFIGVGEKIDDLRDFNPQVVILKPLKMMPYFSWLSVFIL